LIYVKAHIFTVAIPYSVTIIGKARRRKIDAGIPAIGRA
jgi:hypothetical protein